MSRFRSAKGVMHASGVCLHQAAVHPGNREIAVLGIQERSLTPAACHHQLLAHEETVRMYKDKYQVIQSINILCKSSSSIHKHCVIQLYAKFSMILQC